MKRMSRMALLGGILSIAAIAVVSAQSASEPYEADIDRAARDVVRTCANAGEKSLCYEKEVPKYMDSGFTMEQAFELAIAIQTLDPSYTYCHVLAHNISAKETAKDPSKWQNIVARAPFGLCGNGGPHGAFQERFREESMPDASVGEILNLIRGVCDERESWHPSRSQVSNCVHGIGHLSMYITGADVSKSVDVCDAFVGEMARLENVETCYEGIFMQIFQPIEPEDEALVEGIVPDADDTLPYCDSFPGLVRSICIRESWILSADALTDPSALMAQCAPIEVANERAYCIEGVIIGVFSRSYNFDEEKMMLLCEKLDASTKRLCVATIAFRLIQTDWRNMERALAVCSATHEGERDTCFRRIIWYGIETFQTGSTERKSFCSGFPEPWKTDCLN